MRSFAFPPRLQAEKQGADLVGIKLYMDHHVPRAITAGLRLRNVDVITAFEDGTSETSDRDLLDRAAQLGRVLFTQDDDLLAEAAVRQEREMLFPGVVYAHQLHVPIGSCVRDLEIIANAGEPSDMANRAEYLPL